jgi:ankyrin repeat protein
MIAAMNHDHEVIEELLAHGAEVDLRNTFQMTPLMLAAGMAGSGGNGGGGGRGGGPGGGGPDRAHRTIELLVAAGADINYQITDSHTRTATLVSYVQGRDQEGRTALMAAAERGAEALVRHLLSLGADPALRDAQGKSALDLANVPPAETLTPEQREQVGASRKATAALLEAALAKNGR